MRPRSIVVDTEASETERFAAAELDRYLGRMLGARPGVRVGSAGAGSISVKARRRTPLVRVPVREEDESYTIDVRRDRIALVGGSPRAALFAVYAFLEELGCRWFAPCFDFYRGIGAELVPKLKEFAPARGRRVVRPRMLYREIVIEECRTYTVRNAKQVIDWMAKVRMNVFGAPIDYQHSGRFAWDDVRKALVPEIRKRGMIAKIGGHGYENFLHPEEFFDAHPEWFAMVDGKRSRNPHHVFETGNPQAMRTFARRAGDYLETHPEIDILSLWPPDIVTWGTSPESLAQGSPGRRQGLVTHAVRRELVRRKIPVTIEIVTYDKSEKYPENFTYDRNIIITTDYYYQNHSGVVFDPATHEAGHDLSPLDDWTARHKGPLGYFAYNRRYCWQSRPVVTPTHLWVDYNYVYDRGVRGMTGFAEPGDWLTYELQHYLVAKLYEDVRRDIRRLVADYCRTRFGAAGEAMEQYYWTLEKLAVRGTNLFPRDEALSAARIALGRDLLAECRRMLAKAARTPKLGTGRRELIARMKTGLTHQAFALDLHDAVRAPSRKRLTTLIGRNLGLVKRHRNKGLFAEPFWLNENHFMRLYADPLMSEAEKKRRMRQVIDEI